MTKFICKPNDNGNDELTSTENPPIKLVITGSYGNYGWTYFTNRILLYPGHNTVEIDLINATSDSSRAVITKHYSSTGVTAEHSPITKFEAGVDGQSAQVTIHLCRHQMIDFGVFVELTYDKQAPTLLFCDPQASNDPM